MEVISCLPDAVVTINSSDSAKCLNNILQSLLEESFMERNGKLLTNDCFKVTLTVCNADILVYTFLICAFLSFICYRIPWRYMYAYSIVNCLVSNSLLIIGVGSRRWALICIRSPKAGASVCSSQVIHTSSYSLILQGLD